MRRSFIQLSSRHQKAKILFHSCEHGSGVSPKVGWMGDEMPTPKLHRHQDKCELPPCSSTNYFRKRWLLPSIRTSCEERGTVLSIPLAALIVSSAQILFQTCFVFHKSCLIGCWDGTCNLGKHFALWETRSGCCFSNQRGLHAYWNPSLSSLRSLSLTRYASSPSFLFLISCSPSSFSNSTKTSPLG